MKVKVCGLINPENVTELNSLKIDFIGLNFYKPSSRFLDESNLAYFKHYKETKKVGVFVNENIDKLLITAEKFALDYIQLHGNESPSYTDTVSNHFKTIKVFSILEEKDFESSSAYKNCDYFLFDTKTKNHGGSGKKFSWELLSNYKGETPFLLAGGIKPNDTSAIKSIKHPKFAGIDINSGFETKPGIKDINAIESFLKELAI